MNTKTAITLELSLYRINMEIYKIQDQESKKAGYLNFEDFVDTKGLSDQDIKMLDNITHAFGREIYNKVIREVNSELEAKNIDSISFVEIE